MWITFLHPRSYTFCLLGSLIHSGCLHIALLPRSTDFTWRALSNLRSTIEFNKFLNDKIRKVLQFPFSFPSVPLQFPFQFLFGQTVRALANPKRKKRLQLTHNNLHECLDNFYLFSNGVSGSSSCLHSTLWTIRESVCGLDSETFRVLKEQPLCDLNYLLSKLFTTLSDCFTNKINCRLVKFVSITKWSS